MHTKYQNEVQLCWAEYIFILDMDIDIMTTITANCDELKIKLYKMHISKLPIIHWIYYTLRWTMNSEHTKWLAVNKIVFETHKTFNHIYSFVIQHSAQWQNNSIKLNSLARRFLCLSFSFDAIFICNGIAWTILHFDRVSSTHIHTHCHSGDLNIEILFGSANLNGCNSVPNNNCIVSFSICQILVLTFRWINNKSF